MYWLGISFDKGGLRAQSVHLKEERVVAAPCALEPPTASETFCFHRSPIRVRHVVSPLEGTRGAYPLPFFFNLAIVMVMHSVSFTAAGGEGRHCIVREEGHAERVRAYVCASMEPQGLL